MVTFYGSLNVYTFFDSPGTEALICKENLGHRANLWAESK